MAFWPQCRIHHLKKKLTVKSFDVVKSLDRIIIQEIQDHNSINIS
jgi:hypothetical protein